MVRSRPVDDPMDLDALDSRRGRSGSDGFSRGGSGGRRSDNASNYSNECYYCGKEGHMKRNYRQRLNDIRRLDEQHAKRRNRQDFQ